MAIFAPANTTGYRDPMQAATIKALEQRQKDLLAQQAAEPAITPENTQTPVQAFGHIANALGDSFRQRRVDAAISARRDELTKAMTGYDPSGTAPPPPTIAGGDPELYKSLMTQWSENRRNAATIAGEGQRQQAGFTQANTLQAGQFGQQDKTAAEAARVASSAASDAAAVQTERDRAKDRDATIAAAQLAENQAKEKRTEEAAREAAAVAADARSQKQPSTLTIPKIHAAVKAGEMTPEEGEAAIRKENMPAAATQEHIIKHQLESADAQSALNGIDRAIELIDSPASIHAGPQSGWAQSIGEKTPTMLQGLSRYQPDPKTTENTQRYNQILNTEVLAMLNAMKGSSSENELRFNYKIANDPDATLKNKRDAIMFIRNKYAEHVKILNAGIAGAGGTAPKVEKPGSGGAAAAPAAAANPAGVDPLEGRTATGPDGPIIRRGGKWVPNG